jgi:hypothetical protein
MKESWQEELYRVLVASPLEWHPVGDMFRLVARQIPVHLAMRQATVLGQPNASIYHARWLLFSQRLRQLGLEYQDRPKCARVKRHHLARLRPKAHCQRCGGPIYMRHVKVKRHPICAGCTLPAAA